MPTRTKSIPISQNAYQLQTLQQIFLFKNCCDTFETLNKAHKICDAIIQEDDYERHSDLWRDKVNISNKFKLELVFARWNAHCSKDGQFKDEFTVVKLSSNKPMLENNSCCKKVAKTNQFEIGFAVKGKGY